MIIKLLNSIILFTQYNILGDLIFTSDIVTNFLKFQDKSSSYSKSEEQLIVNTKIIYEKTSFKIELMLMDEKEENK